MAGEWSQVTLGDVITLQRGFDLPAQDRKPGKIPIVSSSGITDYHSKVSVPGPGVVTGRYGTIGQVFLIKEDYWPLNTTLWVKDFHGNDPQFASYLLRTVDFRSCSDKSSVPGVNRNDLHLIPVLLPPLTEQRAIAHILGTLDDKIELNRWMNETLEAMARTLFKSWFVGFDPVRAKAEGRKPLGMEAATATLFPDSFQDSPLGKIPKGWRVGRASELTELSRDTINPLESPREAFDHYSIPAFDDGRWPKEETGAEIRSNKYLVPPNAVLLSKLNPRIRRVWLPTVHDDRRSIASTEFLVTLPTRDTSREYIYALFSSQPFLEVFTGLVTGTSGSHQRVQPKSLLDIEVVLPPAACRASFGRIAGPLFDGVSRNVAEVRTLAAIRDALLPKLISGEIRVRTESSVATEIA